MTQRPFDIPAEAGSPGVSAGWIRHYEADYTRDRTVWRRCGAQGKFRNIERTCSQVPPQGVDVARRGKFTGSAAFWLKQTLLRVWPALATCLITYHVAFLASPSAPPMQTGAEGDAQ
jgi:hypothetical protein